MTIVFIPDGYTMTDYIAEVPRLHGAIRFTYRQMVSMEVAVVADAMAKVSGKKSEQLCAAACSRQLISWDITHNGETIEITAANVNRLQRKAMSKLFAIISGAGPGDIDPDADDAKTDDADAEVQALLNDVDAETTPEGNSPAG